MLIDDARRYDIKVCGCHGGPDHDGVIGETVGEEIGEVRAGTHGGAIAIARPVEKSAVQVEYEKEATWNAGVSRGKGRVGEIGWQRGGGGCRDERRGFPRLTGGHPGGP